MNETVPQLSAERPAGPVASLPASSPPRREIQELWLSLSRRAWRSVALVPADRHGAAAAAAAAGALAEVGRRLRLVQVSALVAGRLDYDEAAQLVRRLAALRSADARPGPGVADQVVVAIPSLATDPLGAAVAREADAVVICLELGLTSLAGARQTIELIGQDRIAGCLLLT